MLFTLKTYNNLLTFCLRAEEGQGASGPEILSDANQDAVQAQPQVRIEDMPAAAQEEARDVAEEVQEGVLQLIEKMVKNGIGVKSEILYNAFNGMVSAWGKALPNFADVQKLIKESSVMQYDKENPDEIIIDGNKYSIDALNGMSAENAPGAVKDETPAEPTTLESTPTTPETTEQANSTAPEAVPTTQKEYEVKGGDNLWKIAKKEYAEYIKTFKNPEAATQIIAKIIADYNIENSTNTKQVNALKKKNGNLIFPGKLLLPIQEYIDQEFAVVNAEKFYTRIGKDGLKQLEDKYKLTGKELIKKIMELQTAYNAENADKQIKVDGIAGTDTLRALGLIDGKQTVNDFYTSKAAKSTESKSTTKPQEKPTKGIETAKNTMKTAREFYSRISKTGLKKLEDHYGLKGEVLIRKVMELQTAYNTENADKQIKVDGQAGTVTLRALGLINNKQNANDFYNK